ncbi:Cof-type HAD-IIB family hydrolase [Fodinisporobacter ferrooxydans]
MITIDIDDTLLNDHMQISKATQTALQEAAEQGVVITLATGRMFAAAKPIAARLGLNVPIITYQGAWIKHLLDGTMLYERNVPRSLAGQIFAYAKEQGFHLQVYSEDRLYTWMENEKIKKYSEFSKVPYHIEPDFESLMEQPLAKMLLFEDPDTIDRIEQEVRPMFGSDVHITKSKPYFLEFSHPEATKGHAVKYLAQHYGCELKEVIAIGDSWNDREMIQVAGLGVAMGNAVDALKEIADFVTFTNNDDGVKHVIDTFIFANQA